MKGGPTLQRSQSDRTQKVSSTGERPVRARRGSESTTERVMNENEWCLVSAITVRLCYLFVASYLTYELHLHPLPTGRNC